jgi:hypothetical protein
MKEGRAGSTFVCVSEEVDGRGMGETGAFGGYW